MDENRAHGREAADSSDAEAARVGTGSAKDNVGQRPQFGSGSDADEAPSSPESLWYLLYRFLWPFQYFRDAGRGDRLQQQANYRHNQGMRFCLPGFIFKWSALSAHWFAWGAFFDSTLSFTLLVAGCFVAATMALIMALILGIDWLWLGRFPDRF